MIKVDVENLLIDKSDLDSAKAEFDDLVNKMQSKLIVFLKIGKVKQLKLMENNFQKLRVVL